MCVFKVQYYYRMETRSLMRAFLRDNIDHVIKDSIVIRCAFSQSGKVTICAFDSILRPEYIPNAILDGTLNDSCTKVYKARTA